MHLNPSRSAILRTAIAALLLPAAALVQLPPFFANQPPEQVNSTYYTDVGIRFAFGKEDAWEIFGNTNNVFDQEPRATAQILGRAGANGFKHGLYDILGRRMVVGARLSF